MKRAKVLISGIVQGVNFRYSTYREALSVGVKGYVKNTSDGKVEAQFQGSENQVNQMIDYVRTGPPSAVVEDVAIEWLEEDEGLVGFVISK